MSTISMPNFKEIHQYLALQSSKNLKKTMHTKISITFFWKFYTTDKDENGNVELALESWIESTPILIQATNFKIWPDLTWPWPDFDLRVT